MAVGLGITVGSLIGGNPGSGQVWSENLVPAEILATQDAFPKPGGLAGLATSGDRSPGWNQTGAY